jgi:hypothetical protein
MKNKLKRFLQNQKGSGIIFILDVLFVGFFIFLLINQIFQDKESIRYFFASIKEAF